jgi:hypothetical protein
LKKASRFLSKSKTLNTPIIELPYELKPDPEKYTMYYCDENIYNLLK